MAHVYFKNHYFKNLIMKNKYLTTIAISFALLLVSCSPKKIKFHPENLKALNGVSYSIDENKGSVSLAAKPGGGITMLKDINFKYGSLDIALKGENKVGRSFVGVAFNIQNDSVYESIYFRPFNFSSKEKSAHAIQYIHPPNYGWQYLRENFPGQFEAAYINPPKADDWFEITLILEKDSLFVLDKQSKTRLLSVKRLAKPLSSKIGLWTGNNSKGDFKDLRMSK